MKPEDRKRYEHWIATATIDPDAADRVELAIERAKLHRARFEAAAALVRAPWLLLAALQELEASGRMDRHPANGDPLTHRTVHVPKGLPRHGTPPFTYEQVVEEELAELVRPADGVWSWPAMLYAAERFNGWSYAFKGIRSPYIVAGSTLAMRGKYIADHVFDAEAVSDQVGVLTFLLGATEAGLVGS